MLLATPPPIAPSPTVSFAEARARLQDATNDTQRVAAARSMREAAFGPSRDNVEQVLEGARILDREQGRLGGINGRIKHATVDGTGVAGHDVHAIVKRVHEQGAAEEFTWELAKTLGLHSYFPAVGRRDSGSAYVQRVTGSQPRYGTPELEQIAQRWYRDHVPGLPARAERRAARTDIELLHFVDYLVANSDRRGANMIVDERKGTVNWIDNGLVGMGDHPSLDPASKHRLAPELQYGELLTTAERRTWPPPERAFYDVGDDAIQVIRERLTPEKLAELHGLLQQRVDRRDIAGSRMDEHKSRSNRSMLEWVGSDRFLDNMQARLGAAVRSGGFHFTPFSS
jgi:hypothetical protein